MSLFLVAAGFFAGFPVAAMDPSSYNLQASRRRTRAAASSACVTVR